MPKTPGIDSSTGLRALEPRNRKFEEIMRKCEATAERASGDGRSSGRDEDRVPDARLAKFGRFFCLNGLSGKRAFWG